MGTPREPKAAKYFVALLSSSHEHLVEVENDLVGILGEIDGKSEALSWAAYTYYESEMATDWLRPLVSFSTLASPENLAAVKLQTQAIEERYRTPVSRGRQINLDPGYLDSFKVGLAIGRAASRE